MGRINRIYRISRRVITKSIIILLCSILIYKILKVNIFRHKKQIIVKINDLPTDGGIVLSQQRAAIVKLNKDIMVYSLVCPCHGSEFDLNGKVIKGPANRNLNTLPYKIEGDIVIIYI